MEPANALLSLEEAEARIAQLELPRGHLGSDLERDGLLYCLGRGSFRSVFGLHILSLERWLKNNAQRCSTEMSNLSVLDTLRHNLLRRSGPKAGVVAGRHSPTVHLEPRGFRLQQAAQYCGVTPREFRKLVNAGIMPSPSFRNGGRKTGREIWDRNAIDAALDRLSGDRRQDAASTPEEWLSRLNGKDD